MRHEEWALRLLDTHEFASLGWAAIQAGAPDREEVLDAFTDLERLGLATYDPSNLHWTLTTEGRTAMRFSKKTSHAAATVTTTSGASGLLGGVGLNSGAGVDSSSSPAPASVTASAEALLIEMDGPHALALRAVRDEPTLHERLAEAISEGMPPVDLTETPRYRRAAVVDEETALWASRTRGGPCAICGARSARTGYLPRSSMDVPSVPSFSTLRGAPACNFCVEIHLASGGQSRPAVNAFKALAGLRSLNGANLEIPTFSEFAAHVPTRPGEPWSYITPAFVQGLLRALDLPPHCYITTERDSRLHSFDNLRAKRWDVADLPKPKPTPQVVLEPSPREKQARREHAAFTKRREAERAERQHFREQTFDLVDSGGPRIDPRRTA